jgi:hypothetical protein
MEASLFHILLMVILVGTAFLEDSVILLNFKYKPSEISSPYLRICPQNNSHKNVHYRDVSCSVLSKLLQSSSYGNLNEIICDVLLKNFSCYFSQNWTNQGICSQSKQICRYVVFVLCVCFFVTMLEMMGVWVAHDRQSALPLSYSLSHLDRFLIRILDILVSSKLFKKYTAAVLGFHVM